MLSLFRASTARSTAATTISAVRRISRHTAPVFTDLWSKNKPVVSHPHSRGGLQAWITTLWNERLGLMELDSTVFGEKPRVDILHQVVVWHRACKRMGTAKVKNRAEVRGSTRKIYPQKGSGRARHGDRRAPLFRGGGRCHGPRPKDHSYYLPEKVRMFGMRVALSIKYAQGDLLIVDELRLPKNSRTSLENIISYHKWNSVLFVREEPTWEEIKAPRHMDSFFSVAEKIPQVKSVTLNELTVYDIVRYQQLVLTVPAARMLEEHLHCL